MLQGERAEGIETEKMSDFFAQNTCSFYFPMALQVYPVYFRLPTMNFISRHEIRIAATEKCTSAI